MTKRSQTQGTKVFWAGKATNGQKHENPDPAWWCDQGGAGRWYWLRNNTQSGECDRVQEEIQRSRQKLHHATKEASQLCHSKCNMKQRREVSSGSYVEDRPEWDKTKKWRGSCAISGMDCTVYLHLLFYCISNKCRLKKSLVEKNNREIKINQIEGFILKIKYS